VCGWGGFWVKSLVAAEEAEERSFWCAVALLKRGRL
jgi:hypothetical protein